TGGTDPPTPPRGRRTDGARDTSRPGGARAGLDAGATRGRVVLRPAGKTLRRRGRERRAVDRADGDERGGIGVARRAPAFARLPVRTDEPDRRGRHRRVRPLALPRRSLPARRRAVATP